LGGTRTLPLQEQLIILTLIPHQDSILFLNIDLRKICQLIY